MMGMQVVYGLAWLVPTKQYNPCCSNKSTPKVAGGNLLSRVALFLILRKLLDFGDAGFEGTSGVVVGRLN